MVNLKPIYFLLAVCSVTSFPMYATELKTSAVKVIKEVKHDISIPLLYLFAKTPLNQTKSIKEIMNNQTTVPAKSLTLNITGFTGIGSDLANYQVMNPTPDISASVGLLQYVQWADKNIAVFDKSTGQIATGFPKAGNSVWSGFGGPCETTNVGKTTVKYDQLASKWVLSQIAYDNTSGPFFQCLAVSTSEDATGSYHRYAFQLDAFPDVDKLGAWSDAYYLGLNVIGPPYTGPQLCALDRTNMLAGNAATMQCFNVTSNIPNADYTPADLDGRVAPPQGYPGYFVALNPPQNLIFAKVFIDFTNSTNSKITSLVVPVMHFIPACASSTGNNCAVQPNTTNMLNVYSDKIMGRVAYRQFANYGSFVLNHTVEGPGPKFSPAIRWYELRVLKNDSSLDPVVVQQSTFAPNSMNRFTGSIAIDRFTNIAVGYTVTSSLISPSLELGYHNYADQLNKLTLQPLVTSLGSQVDNVNDWGRSASMTVDPVDECTFWFSGEHLKNTGSMNWSTFILKFKLAACS